MNFVQIMNLFIINIENFQNSFTVVLVAKSQSRRIATYESILPFYSLPLYPYTTWHYCTITLQKNIEYLHTLPHTKSKHAGFNYELFKIHSEICIIPILFFSYCELYHNFCKLYDCIVHIIKKFTIKLLYCNNNTVQN